MIRLGGLGLGFVALVGVWIYAVFDVIRTDRALIRYLPKLIWLLLIVVVPVVGPIGWLVVGRPRYAGWRPGGNTGRTPRRPLGPEDRPDWGG